MKFFKEKVSPISQNHIKPIIGMLEEELGIKLTPLGSTLKEVVSGDIDLGVCLDISHKKDFANKLLSLDFVHEIKLTSAVHAIVDPGIEECKPVQVDFFLDTDVDWLSTYYHHSVESKYKGLYRNLLMVAIVENKFIEHNGNLLPDGTYEETVRFKWSPVKGLMRVKEKRKFDYSKRKFKNDQTCIFYTKNISNILKYLELPNNVTLFDSFEGLYKGICESYKKYEQKTIFSNYCKFPDIIKYGIPGEIISQDRVGIPHIYSLNKPTVYSAKEDYFLKFIYSVYKVGGIINTSNSTIAEKIDGYTLKAGQTQGNKFIQSSYSGPVFDKKDFLTKIKYKPLAEAFFNNYDLISGIFHKNTSNNYINNIEWLPMCIKRGEGNDFVRFHTIKYDKRRLGKYNTFFIFDDVDVVSTEENKVIKPSIDITPIDLRSYIEEVFYLNEKQKPLLDVQQRVYEYILKCINESSSITSSFEGIVISINNITVKINSKQYMNEKFNLKI